MPLTSPELVRAHLHGRRAAELTVSEEAITLTGTQAAQLAYAGLVSGSVVVKAIRSGSPTNETIMLSDDWAVLPHTHLVAGSVLVAADTSLGGIFVENIDYIVDAPGGRIKRIAGGSINTGATVSVWYNRYSLYVSGDDYTVDHAEGRITRRANGAIADGQTVLVDYRVSPGTIADAIIENAIAEAAEAVAAIIDPRFHNEPAPGIIIGETHWAVAAVCRVQAAAALTDVSAAGASGRSSARAWLELADRYERSGRERLSRFAAPVTARRSAQRN